jgi:hypothetical protein
MTTSPSPETERQPEPLAIDRRLLVRDAIRYSSLIGGLCCATLAIAGLPNLAIALAVGTLFGEVNFVLLARGVSGAIDSTVAGVARAQQEAQSRDPTPVREVSGPLAADGLEPKDVLGRPLGAGGPFRLALSVLLVAALLWWIPTDPAGLAMGIVITLLGASVAALRHHRRAR